MKSPDPVVDEREAEEVAQPGAPTFSPLRLVMLAAALAALGWWQGWKLVVVILSIVAMIFLHELGHFVTARRAGMKVTEFFISFGPRIWSFRRGEVEYGIKAIPAGAYVRIIGMMNVDEVPPEDEPRTYRQKGFWSRISVAVAGSTMHFILALLLFGIAYASFGFRDDTTWAVAESTPGSAAALAGIRIGDRVVSVDGQPVSTFDEMSQQVRRRPGETVDVVVLRKGERETIRTQLGARAALIGTVGQDLALGAYDGEVRVNSINPASRAGKAGLRDGDLVRFVNGVPLSSLGDLDDVVAATEGGKLVIEYEHHGEPATATVNLGTDVDSTNPTGFFGVGSKTVSEDVGVFEAGGRAFQTFGRGVVLTVEGIGKVFNPANLANFASKTVQPETNDDRPTPAADSQVASSSGDLNRPVSIIGIVGLGNQLTNVQSFLLFLAGVNLTIGVINLVPLLPFDGGHVAVACYERVREFIRGDGKRYFVDANKLMAPTYAVVIIMVFVGLLAGYSDIVRPIQL